MRFTNWQYPKFDEMGMTKWGWMCQHHENLILGEQTDIGCGSYLNAKFGIEIQENCQIASHVSIYSINTIDNTQGKVTIKKNSCVGANSVILPGVTIGENSIIGALSLVNKDIPNNCIAFGIPVRVRRIKK